MQKWQFFNEKDREDELERFGSLEGRVSGLANVDKLQAAAFAPVVKCSNGPSPLCTSCRGLEKPLTKPPSNRPAINPLEHFVRAFACAVQVASGDAVLAEACVDVRAFALRQIFEVQGARLGGRVHNGTGGSTRTCLPTGGLAQFRSRSFARFFFAFGGGLSGCRPAMRGVVGRTGPQLMA